MPADCGSCGSYSRPRGVGRIAAALDELSGLAASRVHPGVVYAHNDSGDVPRFFALGEGASARGEFHVEGATAVDWEDLAVGPCPAGSCVFLADIGDNLERRAAYAVYRVAEPALPPAGLAAPLTMPADPLLFAYPDGPHNAETLLVAPGSGDLYVVTKPARDQARVYRFPRPFTPGAPATLRFVATLNVPASAGRVTGGDLHPCERRLLIRTTRALHELASPGEGSLDALFLSTPREVPVAAERQGEAVAYRLDGRGYFTASEGAEVELHASVCE
ncbi:MAG: hypothetical protein FJ104_11810 [Deltaproteobacteria bacterium]|nr:hypothetical protein [Deltaproteobacteria bacterium]